MFSYRMPYHLQMVRNAVVDVFVEQIVIGGIFFLMSYLVEVIHDIGRYEY